MADDDPFDEALVQEEDLEHVEDDAQASTRRAQDQAELELMAAWVAGDRSAGNQLVRAYLKPITRFFQSKVHDTTRAEQLVSDFLEQLTRAPKQVKTSVRAYVFGVARFTLLRHFREQRGNLEDPMDVSLASLDDREPAFVANQRAETRLVLRALRRINFRQAIVIEMYYFEGMRAPEIAEIFGDAQGTVRSQIRLGLVNLQREMIAMEHDSKVLAASQSTYTWLAGLVRYIEALRAKPK